MSSFQPLEQQPQQQQKTTTTPNTNNVQSVQEQQQAFQYSMREVNQNLARLNERQEISNSEVEGLRTLLTEHSLSCKEAKHNLLGLKQKNAALSSVVQCHTESLNQFGPLNAELAAITMKAENDTITTDDRKKKMEQIIKKCKRFELLTSLGVSEMDKTLASRKTILADVNGLKVKMVKIQKTAVDKLAFLTSTIARNVAAAEAKDKQTSNTKITMANLEFTENEASKSIDVMNLRLQALTEEKQCTQIQIDKNTSDHMKKKNTLIAECAELKEERAANKEALIAAKEIAEDNEGVNVEDIKASTAKKKTQNAKLKTAYDNLDGKHKLLINRNHELLDETAECQRKTDDNAEWMKSNADECKDLSNEREVRKNEITAMGKIKAEITAVIKADRVRIDKVYTDLKQKVSKGKAKFHEDYGLAEIESKALEELKKDHAVKIEIVELLRDREVLLKKSSHKLSKKEKTDAAKAKEAQVCKEIKKIQGEFKSLSALASSIKNGKGGACVEAIKVSCRERCDAAKLKIKESRELEEALDAKADEDDDDDFEDEETEQEEEKVPATEQEEEEIPATEQEEVEETEQEEVEETEEKTDGDFGDGGDAGLDLKPEPCKTSTSTSTTTKPPPRPLARASASSTATAAAAATTPAVITIRIPVPPPPVRVAPAVVEEDDEDDEDDYTFNFSSSAKKAKVVATARTGKPVVSAAKPVGVIKKGAANFGSLSSTMLFKSGTSAPDREHDDHERERECECERDRSRSKSPHTSLQRQPFIPRPIDMNRQSQSNSQNKSQINCLHSLQSQQSHQSRGSSGSASARDSASVGSSSAVRTNSGTTGNHKRRSDGSNDDYVTSAVVPALKKLKSTTSAPATAKKITAAQPAPLPPPTKKTAIPAKKTPAATKIKPPPSSPSASIKSTKKALALKPSKAANKSKSTNKSKSKNAIKSPVLLKKKVAVSHDSDSGSDFSFDFGSTAN